MDNGANKRKRRPNGHGSVVYKKNENRWQARYTAQTPKGRKRRTLTAKTEEEAWGKLYKALGWWDEDGYKESCITGQCVYFLQGLMGGPIKIGTAVEFGRRLTAIQACSPVLLRPLYLIPEAGKEVERKLHQRFAPFRLHGEWFEPSRELLEYIHYLKGEPTPAVK